MIFDASTRARRIGAALALALLAAGCSDPAPSILGATPPPMGAADLPPAAVGLALGEEGMRGVSEAPTQRGLADYFARNVPQWRGGAPSGADDLRLLCDIDQEGMSNCSPTLARCELLHDGAVIERFETRRETETCMMGGDVDAYRAQAYNDGVALGEELARRVRRDPELMAALQAAADAEALAEASRSGDRETLERIRDTRPGTDDALAAEAALARLDRQEADARQEAERLAAEQAETEAAAARAEAAAQAQAPAAPAPAQARQAETVAPAPTPAAPEPDPADALRLSCDSAANGLCGDYEFGSRAERDDFAARCRAMGSRVLEGGAMCERRNAGCRHRNGSTTVVTWVYGLSASQVNAQCSGSGGRPVAP